MENSTGGPPFLTQAGPQPQMHRRLSLGVIILTSAIALLLIAGSVLIYYSLVVQPAVFHTQATATALTRFQQTARANATSTAQAMQTAQAVANATATAQALATAQAAATATARQAIYTQATQGTPALNDPLSSNINNWDVGTDNNGDSCAFTGGAYHISELQPNNAIICLAEGTSFSDLAFQVQMTIIKGDGGGGIIFRASTSGVMDYEFLVQQDGTYTFAVYLNGSHSRVLKSGFSPIINTGLNSSNELTVVARGHTFYLYVNKQYLADTSDSTYTSGAIGLFASDLTKATEVAFQNAQVWALS